jgi:hypothetical protein
MPSDAGPAPARRRPRGGALALAGVLALVAGAVIAVFVTARRIEGSVPGKGGLLSLAATDAGFVVGTTNGAFASADGRTWFPVEGLSGPAPVAGDGNRVLIGSGRAVMQTTDLGNVSPVATLPFEPTAIATGPGGAIYTVDREGNLARVDPGGGVGAPVGTPGPGSALGLAVVEPRIVYAGALASGLWRSEDGGSNWGRILHTPAQAILPAPAEGVAPEAVDRILLATPGGVLVSRDGGGSWELSGLQVPVHGLARHGGVFFAVTRDRLVLRSADGETKWEPLIAPAP